MVVFVSGGHGIRVLSLLPAIANYLILLPHSRDERRRYSSGGCCYCFDDHPGKSDDGAFAT